MARAKMMTRSERGSLLVRMRVRRYLELSERFVQLRAAEERLSRIQQHMHNELSAPAEWKVRCNAHRAVEMAQKCLEVERLGLGYQVVEAGRLLPFKEWQQARIK